MNDGKLKKRLEDAISRAKAFFEQGLASEVAEVQKYYDGTYPRRNHKGSSTYRSLDVHFSVNRLKDQLLETFGTYDSIVEFAPEGGEDEQAARVETATCETVIHRQNPGYRIFSDVIHNALTARAGVAKVWWENAKRRTKKRLPQPLPAEAIGALLQPGDEVLEAVEVQPGVYQVTLAVEEDASQVRIAALPPEEFLISPSAESIEAAPFVAHRRMVSRSDMLSMGFGRAEVRKVFEAAGDGEAGESYLSSVRLQDLGYSDGERDADRERIWLYECYVHWDLDGDGIDEIAQVFLANGQILSVEEAPRKPFVAFVPLPLPHRFYGENFAKIVVPTQNAKTVLVRGILDHTVVTNNPRYLVVKGSLLNPQELLDNRLGGIVNVSRPEGVLPLPQGSLNPFVFETLKLLDYQNEQHSGISQLSSGLNKDAVARQNSFALVNQLTDMGMVGQRVVARRFATEFLVPLYRMVHELLREYGAKPMRIEVGGRPTTVNPAEMQPRGEMKVAFHLAYKEAERRAAELLQVDQMLTADPMAAGVLYSVQGKRRILSEILRLKGVKDVDNVLTPLQQIQPPDPMQDPQVQIEMARLKLAEREVALKEAEAQQKAAVTQAKVAIDAQKTAEELALRERKEAHTYEIAVRELEAAEKQAERNPEQARGIFSPNS